MRVVEGARDGGGTGGELVVVGGGVMWWVTHGHILTVPMYGVREPPGLFNYSCGLSNGISKQVTLYLAYNHVKTTV